MGVDFVLRLADGTNPVTLPDPGSGTFDAAGGFEDVLFREGDDELEVLSRADPYDTVVFTHDKAEGMLRDIEVLWRGTFSDTVQLRRGIEPQVGAGSCDSERWPPSVATPGSAIVQHGD